MTYVSTSKELGSNTYDAVQNIVSGTPDYVFVRSAEQLYCLNDHVYLRKCLNGGVFSGFQTSERT